MKLSRAIADWIRDLRGIKSPSTVAGYESDLSRLKGAALQDSILHFTPELVRNHLMALSVAGCKPSTLHRKQVAFNQFAKWGKKHGLWAANPIEDMPKRPRPKNLPRPFTKPEAVALLALELPPQERMLRALLFFTGLRITPICTLKVGDASFDPPSIRALVKGAKVQVIQMHEDLAPLLQHHILTQTDLKPQSFVLRQRGGRPFNRKLAEKITERWGAKAGVPVCKPHRFRHTFATELLRSGVDVRVVKEALGHEDIASTMIYTEVTNEDLRSAIGRLKWTV